MPDPEDPVPIASTSAPTAAPFWDRPGGLDLPAAWLLPGGRILEFRLRGGQSYELELGTLGLAAPGLFAMPDLEGRAVVLATGAGALVELTTSRLLAACEPAFREARERAAAIPEPFGALVRARRLAVGRSVQEAAAAAGMAPSNDSRIEASRHRPRLDTMERVAAALAIGIPDLLAGRRGAGRG